jgi:ATP-binding cassette, subfamily C (CFTR/MRP), member 1
MAIGLFLLTIFNSICQHQFFWRSMSTGVLSRTALIGSLYKRGLSLTPRERTIHPGSALVNHMSTDISRVDFAVSFCNSIYPCYTNGILRHNGFTQSGQRLFKSPYV